MIINKNAPITITVNIIIVLNSILSISAFEIFCHIDKPQRDRAAIVIPARILAVFLRILSSEKIKIWPIFNVSKS